MMIFSRRPGEAILIGDDVEVVVINVGRGRIQLGFNAPKSVDIRRVDAPADTRVMGENEVRKDGTGNK